MAYSNSTNNLKLPQWEANDKPTWLTDMNGAFRTIDSSVTKGENDINNVQSKVDNLGITVASNTESIHQNATSIVAANNAIANNTAKLNDFTSLPDMVPLNVTAGSNVNLTSSKFRFFERAGVYILFVEATLITTAPITDAKQTLVSFDWPLLDYGSMLLFGFTNTSPLMFHIFPDTNYHCITNISALSGSLTFAFDTQYVLPKKTA